MKAKVALVVWDDAWETPGEVPLSEWVHEGYETYAVGWVVNHDKNGITLCHEWWPRNVESMRNPSFIPKGMIKKVVYLDVPEEKPCEDYDIVIESKKSRRKRGGSA